MRRLLPVLAVLGVVVLWPAPASAADARVDLSPGHGQASASFTATYHGPTALGICRVSGSAEFQWDGAKVGTASISGCTATLTITPPEGKNAVGKHTVKAFGRNIFGTPLSASATYTVDAKPAPSPSPTPTPSASPTPRPTPTPGATKPPVKPKPSQAGVTPSAVEPSAAVPSESATAAPSAVENEPTGPVADCDPLAAPRSEAGGELRPGGIPVDGVRPASLLPSIVDFTGLPPMLLTVTGADAVLPFREAMAAGVSIPCVHLDLGPTDSFTFANYALSNVRIAGIEEQGGEATVKLTYRAAAWRYQLVASDKIVVGGTEVQKSSGTNKFATAMYVAAGVIAILGGAGWFWFSRRERARHRA